MTQKLFAHATAWKIPRCSEGIKEKFYLYVGPASGRISNIEAKSARLELPQRAPFPCLLSMILGHCSPKAKQDTWYRTSFKTVPSCLPCYYHGELFVLFSSQLLLSFLPGLCNKTLLHRSHFRQDLCSDLFPVFMPSMLSEHKHSQKDIKNCLLRIFSVQTHTPPHTPEPLPRQPTFLLAFGFFAKQIAKQL